MALQTTQPGVAINSQQCLEDLLRIFAISLPISIAIVKDGKIRFTNPQFRRLLGYNEDELMDMNLQNLVPPEDKSLIEEYATKALKTQVQSTYEHRFVSKAGEVRWVIETLTPIPYPYEGGRAVLVYSVDITERKRTEEALRLSSEMFAKAFHSSPDPITLTTLEDGQYIELNDAYVDLIGYSREEAIGHTACELGFWPKPQYRDEMLKLLRKHGAVHNLEIRFGVKSGEKRLALLSVEKIDIAGKPYLVSVVHDITERRRLEEALRDSEEFSSSLLSNSANPILVVNPDTSITYVNPALEKLSGFHSEELIGTKAPYPWWTEEGTRRTIPSSQKSMRIRIRTREERFRRKNGECFWVRISTVPIKKKGEIRYYLSNWIDVTREKQLMDNVQYYIGATIRAQEEERKRISRELHDETVQSLVSLNIALHNIMAADKKLSDNTIRRMERLGATISKMAEEMRRFSHQLRPGLLDRLGLIASLGFLIEDMETQYNIRCHIELVGYERRLSPEAEVILFRIAQEALRNAGKHTKATDATVTIEFAERKVRLRIADNGIGFRVPRGLSSLARKGKLGMIGMSERARLLNGRFYVKSEPGKGTVVTVELPLEAGKPHNNWFRESTLLNVPS